MAFKKGESGNPNGRPHGSLSARTVEWMALGDAITTKHAKRFNDILEDLDDEKFLDHFERILEYFQPKLARTENKTDVTLQKDIVVDL